MSVLEPWILFRGNRTGEFYAELLRTQASNLSDDRNAPNSLSSLMLKHGSDKWGEHHNYTNLYWELFAHRQQRIRNVFEIGIGSNYTDTPSNMGPNGVPGASLRGWRDFFPQATIIGGDIDRRILFEEPRIATIYVDQRSSESVSSMWATLGPTQYELIVDDGLHDFEANKTFFLHSIGKLEEDGVFVIEDLIMETSVLQQYELMLKETCYEFAIVALPHVRNRYDNALAVLKKTEIGSASDCSDRSVFFKWINNNSGH